VVVGRGSSDTLVGAIERNSEPRDRSLAARNALCEDARLACRPDVDTAELARRPRGRGHDGSRGERNRAADEE
jgi:hypothetical protein